MKSDFQDGNFDLFANPLFTPRDDTPEGRERIARDWKKVCSKPESQRKAKFSPSIAGNWWPVSGNTWPSDMASGLS